MARFLLGFSLRTADSASSSVSSALRRVANASAGSKQDLPKPTYTYQSPGSSMCDPSYNTGHSLGSPTYFEFDPKPTGHSLSEPAQDQTVSLAALSAAKTSASSKTTKQDMPKPSYVLTPPGSSLSDVRYGISVKDPVYFRDPVPQTHHHNEATTTAAGGADTSASKAHDKHQPVQQEPPAGKSRKGLAADDYAQVPYVTSPKGSMKEPHYVSMSDPQDDLPQK